jgi:regulator of protease activity HflC (stomatin/prohibitin superfamily)
MESLPVAILALAAFFIFLSVKIVPQSDMWVVERLGKFHSVLHGGFHVIIPFIDNVRAHLTTKEQIIDIPRQPVITKDNVNIVIDGMVYIAVYDAKVATYNVMNFKQAMSSLAMTTLRSEIGNMQLDDTLSNRDKLNAKLQMDLDAAGQNWGIKVMRVEISEISVPQEIEEAMNLQMKAEREKRAIELNAEAEKQAVIKAAEGQKQKEVLNAEAIERIADAKKYEQERVAEGQKKAMELINEAMANNEMASEFLLAKDRIKAFDSLASSDSKDKVIIPFETAEFVGSLSMLKSFLGDKKEEK